MSSRGVVLQWGMRRLVPAGAHGVQRAVRESHDEREELWRMRRSLRIRPGLFGGHVRAGVPIPPDLFQRVVRERAMQFQEVRLARLEDVLASRTEEPEAWANHVRRLLRAAEIALEAPDYPLALDMQGAPEQRRAQVRSYVRAYGELLTAWPVLRAVARDVRRSGRGLIPE